MRIFHVATRADWQEAMRSGAYRTSTRGLTLDEEGFIHAAYDEQVPGVLDRYYADVTEPLVVLEIETDDLDVPWRDDAAGDETFPHIYGALATRAVVDVRPVDARHTRKPPPVPSPRAALVTAFRGLSVVLAVASITLFVAGFLAEGKAHDRTDRLGQFHRATLPTSVEFVLFSFAVAAALAAITAWAVATSQMSPVRRPDGTAGDR